MKRQSIPLPAICAAAFSFASCFAAATVHASGAPTVQAADAWVRWLPNKLPAAGYVTLTNNGDKPVDLTMTSSPDYGSVMLHQTISNGSTSQMVMVEKATVPAHGALKVAPGGYHFMLEDATHRITPGDTVHLRMQFSDGTTLDTPFIVKSPAQAK